MSFLRPLKALRIEIRKNREVSKELIASLASKENYEKIQNITALQREASVRIPDSPLCFGWKAYSQNDEDGIIQHCLEKISEVMSLSKTCMEFCCGDGSENNTHMLLLQGYRGVWLDGDSYNISVMQREFGGLNFERLMILNEWLDIDTLEAVLEKGRNFLADTDIDLFSLDVDGNDLHFARVIAEKIKPKLFVIEYNAKFPPPIVLTVNYNKMFTWTYDDFQGASLQCFVDALPQYHLVSCNITGSNAFFVRQEFSHLFPDYTTEQLYQPARYWLASYATAHPSSLKWLRQQLK